MQEQKRVRWIDYARLVMSIFVICFHYKYTPDFFVNIVYPFTLPFFFFVSGYFYNLNGKVKSLWNRVKSTIPIMIVSSILSIIINGINAKEIFLAIEKLVVQVRPKEHLWFLACYLVCQVILFLLGNICKNEKKLIYGCLCCFAIGVLFTCFLNIELPWFADIALVQMLFVGVGILFRWKEELFCQIINKYIWLFALLYLATFFFNGVCDIHRREYQCFIAYIIQVLAGLCLIIYIFRKTEKYKWNNAIYLGKNSIYIYVFHGYCLMLFGKLVEIFFKVDHNKIWLCILLTLLAVSFSLVILYVLLRLKDTMMKLYFDRRKCHWKKGDNISK